MELAKAHVGAVLKGQAKPKSEAQVEALNEVSSPEHREATRAPMDTDSRHRPLYTKLAYFRPTSSF